MPGWSRKRPRDLNQLAEAIADIATNQVEDGNITPESGKYPAAVALGRLGLKGGKAGAAKMSREEGTRIARDAAAVRWKKDDR